MGSLFWPSTHFRNLDQNHILCFKVFHFLPLRLCSMNMKNYIWQNTSLQSQFLFFSFVRSLILCSDCITCWKLQKQRAQVILSHSELRLPLWLLLRLSLWQLPKLKQGSTSLKEYISGGFPLSICKALLIHTHFKMYKKVIRVRNMYTSLYEATSYPK